MSLFKIAWRSIQHRGLASLLTTLSMTLGVTMVVAVLAIHGVVTESFQSNSGLGYSMIVGAEKGGKLQLTLNTVYYLSQPVENIPYDYYLEFLQKDERTAELKAKSLAYAGYQQRRQLAELESLMSTIGMAGPQLAVTEAARQAASQIELEKMGLDRKPEFDGFIRFAIPVCLGDYYGEYRVVATTPDMFDKLIFDEENQRGYEFAQGRNFQVNSKEHGFFEAVVGATVARKMDVKLGQKIYPSHGAPTDEGGTPHGEAFTVVGILAPSGTPNDRGVFINMEGFYLMENHAKPLEEEDSEEGASEDEASKEGEPQEESAEPAVTMPEVGGKTALPIEQREVTAILVRPAHQFYTMRLQRIINKGDRAQAVLPIRQITQMLLLFVTPFQVLLLILTGTICVVSGVSILVSIYNSMSERRHEIAVIRALGAKRGTVMSVVLLEAVMLALAGGFLGWGLGHAGIALANPWIEAETGVSMGFFDTAPRITVIEPRTIKSYASSEEQSDTEDESETSLEELFGPSANAPAADQETPYKKTQGPPFLLKWIKFYESDNDGLRLMLEVTPEALIVPALVLLAIIVGILPAFAAYRTDVAESLGK